MARHLALAALLGLACSVEAQEPAAASALRHSVEQLRSSIGRWETTTSYLNEDGSVARAVVGTYEFSWIVPDRVVTGKSEIPELGDASAILFYVSESAGHIEMVSVGRDGNLWIMTGPLGGEERRSQEFRTDAGATAQLRFTRFNVSAEAFESRMNHQRFRRVPSAARG